MAAVLVLAMSMAGFPPSLLVVVDHGMEVDAFGKSCLKNVLACPLGKI